MLYRESVVYSVYYFIKHTKMPLILLMDLSTTSLIYTSR